MRSSAPSKTWASKCWLCRRIRRSPASSTPPMPAFSPTSTPSAHRRKSASRSRTCSPPAPARRPTTAACSSPPGCLWRSSTRATASRARPTSSPPATCISSPAAASNASASCPTWASRPGSASTASAAMRASSRSSQLSSLRARCCASVSCSKLTTTATPPCAPSGRTASTCSSTETHWHPTTGRCSRRASATPSSDRLLDQIRERGVTPIVVDVSEFLKKGGGSVKCMIGDLGVVASDR